MSNICNCIKACCSDNFTTLVIGDLNCGDIDWVNHYVTTDENQVLLFDTVTDLGFHQFVDSSTRGDNILDVVLCNDPLLISDVTVCHPFSTSDHASIKFVLNVSEYISVHSKEAVVHESRTRHDCIQSPDVVQSKTFVNRSKTNWDSLPR